MDAVRSPYAGFEAGDDADAEDLDDEDGARASFSLRSGSYHPLLAILQVQGVSFTL